jgi:YqaJ-like recombinase protein
MKTSLTEEHLAWRRLGVGASDAARVMSGDWRSLWQEKRGIAQGRKVFGEWGWSLKASMETLQLDWYEHKTGRAVGRSERLVSAAYPFMRASLDGRIFETGEPIDAKHVSPWSKPDPITWCIEHYTWQMIHQATVCESDRGYLSIGVGDKEPVIQPVEVDPFDQAKLIAACREFWGFVERGEELPGDGPSVDATPVPIVKLREIHVPVEIDEVFEALCRQNNWLGDACAEMLVFSSTDAAAKRHAVCRENLKKLVPEDVATLTRGRFRLTRAKNGTVTMSAKPMEKE